MHNIYKIIFKLILMKKVKIKVLFMYIFIMLNLAEYIYREILNNIYNLFNAFDSFVLFNFI